MLNLRRVRTLTVFFMLVLAAGPVLAAEPSFGWQPAAVATSGGVFGIWDDRGIVEAGWEARFAPRRFRWLPRWVPDPVPVAGVMASSRGSLYGYAGFRWEIPLGGGWEVSPQWAAGLYYRDAGFDLGGALEFRSGIELTRRIGERHRIGLVLYHLSNAGLYWPNSGSESLAVTFSSRP
jgi:hypothetical protein